MATAVHNRRFRAVIKHNQGRKRRVPKRAKACRRDKRSPAPNAIPIFETSEQQQAREAREFERRRRAELIRAKVELDPLDGRILECLMRHPKITHRQIADLLGIGRRQTVTSRINAPKFQRALKEANLSAVEIFELNKRRAARVLGQMLGSPDERIKLRAALSFMWPEIHDQAKAANGPDDFITFIREAFERATNGDTSTADGETPASAPARTEAPPQSES